MKAAIQNKFPEAEVDLIQSGGGVFEVMLGDKLIFSKKQTGRFPEENEIFNAVSA